MSTTFLLPDLGEGLTEADILEWKVAVGDEVVIDQAVVEVETAKAAIEVPSPYAGTVLTLHADAGETLAVGSPLITVGAAASAPEEPAPTAEGAAPAELHPDAQRYREEEQAGSGNVLVGYGTKETSKARRRRPREASAPSSPKMSATTAGATRTGGATQVVKVVSPIVRRIALEGGLNLAEITPTGAGSVVTRRDVQAALAADTGTPAAASAEATGAEEEGQRRRPMSAFRQAVAAKLSRSRTEIPEATVWVDVDATPLWELRESQRPDPESPGLLAYIARFVLAGLSQYPMFNARLDGEDIVEHDYVHLGVAVQGSRGLVVPAVKDAHSLTARQLHRELRQVAADAREGSIPQVQGTFTINNYGALRVDGSAAIINHPQVAILGVGRIIDRPWVVGGELTARKITQLSFAFDHRISDGAEASGFLRVVADAMENPGAMLADL